MTAGHATMLFLGFLCCEAVFATIEHWFKGKEEKFRRAKHTAFLVWIFHPAAMSAGAEWANHVIAVAMAMGGH